MKQRKKRLAGHSRIPKHVRNKQEDLNKILLEMESVLRESADVMHTAALVAKLQKLS